MSGNVIAGDQAPAGLAFYLCLPKLREPAYGSAILPVFPLATKRHRAFPD